MELLLKRIETSLEDGALDTMNGMVRELEDIWGPHIEVEETYESIEVAAELSDEDEQLRMAQMFAEYSQQHSGPDYLVVPFLLFNVSPEDSVGNADATGHTAGTGPGRLEGQMGADETVLA